MKLALENTQIAQNTDAQEEIQTEVGHEVEAQGPIGAVAGQFGLDGQIFVAQLINFAIVLGVLWLFAYKPIMRFLKEREEKIEKSVKQADEIEARLAAIEKEQEQTMAQARKQAQDVLEKAQKDADIRREEIIGSAKREVERVITKGKEQLTEEREQMLKDVRGDIIDISLKAAARILQDQVDEKKSKSLAEEVVRKMT